MANKFSIILFVPYFGKLPSYFSLWLKSCEHNPTIHWVVFTDDIVKYEIPGNVTIQKIEFGEFTKKIQDKLLLTNQITGSYKLCDFKPAYGVIFDAYISDYDFWGYCDLDMIFGDIRGFITDDILTRHNKILNRGHLTIFKNTSEVNNYFRLPHPQIDYMYVFNSTECHGFDEWYGMYEILNYHNIRHFHDEFIADISPLKMKMETTRVNYKYQAFYWDKGRMYHVFEDNYSNVHSMEICYIHMQKRKLPSPNFDVKTVDSFFITPHGFKVKKGDVTTRWNLIKNNIWNPKHLVDLNVKKITNRIGRVKRLI